LYHQVGQFPLNDVFVGKTSQVTNREAKPNEPNQQLSLLKRRTKIY